MTAEELLKPRFEVIADYPGNQLIIGTIIISDDDEMFKVGEGWFFGLKKIESMPYLFRLLNWWEKRKVDDMPKKVKRTIDGRIFDVNEWVIDLFNNSFLAHSKGLTLFIENGFEPID